MANGPVRHTKQKDAVMAISFPRRSCIASWWIPDCASASPQCIGS